MEGGYYQSDFACRGVFVDRRVAGLGIGIAIEGDHRVGGAGDGSDPPQHWIGALPDGIPLADLHWVGGLFSADLAKREDIGERIRQVGRFASGPAVSRVTVPSIIEQCSVI